MTQARHRPPAGRRVVRWLRPGHLGVLVAVAAATAVTLGVFSQGWLTRLDHRVAYWAWTANYGHGTPGRTLALHAGIMPGDRLGIGLVVTPFVGWLAWRRRSWQPVLRFAVALAVVAAVVWAGKAAVGRTPPGAVDLVRAGGRSYPSGHTIAAVVMAGLVAALAADFALPAAWRRLLRALAWLAPFTTAAGMVLLAYHWLTDVLAGLAVGVLSLRVIHVIFAGRLRDWGNASRLARSGPDGRGGGAARAVGQRAG